MLAYSEREPRTRAEAKKLNQLPTSTHYKKTAELLSWGILKKDAETDRLVRDASFGDWDFIAEALGTTARAKRRHSRHELDRAARLQAKLDAIWIDAGGTGLSPLHALGANRVEDLSTHDHMTALDAYRRLRPMARGQAAARPAGDRETDDASPQSVGELLPLTEWRSALQRNGEAEDVGFGDVAVLVRETEEFLSDRAEEMSCSPSA
jgi:hypothetical protein